MKKYLLILTVLLAFIFISCKDSSGPVDPGNNTSEYLNGSLKVSDVVIYEMFVRNFSNEGTFNAIVPRLDELKNLGVNTIWLMPIHPIGSYNRIGTYGSPYAVRDYYAVNPDMGSAQDFKNLVNEIHKRGMLVIIDWVANHTAWDHSWITDHSNWYTKDANGNIQPPRPDWQDVADLNYSNADLRAEMINAMTYWVTEFNIDGFRCDAADMVPNDFWSAAIPALRKLKPLFMLAETETKSVYSAGFNVTYSWSLYEGLKDIFNGTNTSIFTSDVMRDLNSLSYNQHRLRFTTNHDETSWDLTPPELFGGIQGAMAASVITFSLKGIPMLYNGQEVGSNIHQNLFEKSYINWNANPDMWDFYSDLLYIYNNNLEFREGNTEVVYLSDELVSFTRSIGSSMIWIVVNPQRNARETNLPSSLQGTRFTNLFTDEEITTTTSISVPAYGYYILKKMN